MRLGRVSVARRTDLVAGAVGSVIVHLTAAAAVLFAVHPASGLEQQVYAVELVAAPLPAATQAVAAEPAPAPPAPAAPAKAAKVKPIAKPKTRDRLDRKREPAPPAPSKVTPLPGEKPGTGTDIANVRTEGKQFPYPEYLENIVTQIYRRWARPLGSGALRAEVSFTIERDGLVRDIKVVQSSRSYSFDLEAVGAIEQAAAARSFGPLPSGWPADILQVAFSFTPRQP